MSQAMMRYVEWEGGWGVVYCDADEDPYAVLFRTIDELRTKRMNLVCGPFQDRQGP